MMIERLQMVMATAATIAWATAALGQGLYWESKTTGIGNEARTTQTYAMPKMLKIVSSDGQVMILRADQNTVIAIEPKKQTYRELSFTDMAAAAKAMQPRMAAARAEMEKQMKDMPPEQRAMMEKMMSQLPGADTAKPANVVVKNTGETKTVNGYGCTKYVATADGKTILVVWATKDVKGFEGLRDDWVAYQRQLGEANRALAAGMADAYAKIEGFPMQTEMGEVKTEVTKVETRTTAAGEFGIPAGFKKESVNLPKAPQP